MDPKKYYGQNMPPDPHNDQGTLSEEYKTPVLLQK